ncbi:hypothetical protein D3C76_1502390 [compost metagenome]
MPSTAALNDQARRDRLLTSWRNFGLPRMRSQRCVSVEWMSVIASSTLFLLSVCGGRAAEFGVHEPEAAGQSPATVGYNVVFG